MSDPLLIVLNMDSGQSEREWAGQEFGLAALGDKRRVDRLVALAARTASQPSGKVTAVFGEAKEREGTYRLLENHAVKATEVALASHRACARRVASDSSAFVAVDGTSLSLTDTKRQKGLGLVGARFVGATGLQVMSALAVSRAGVPMGLCGQEYWTRKKASKRGKKKKDPRTTKQKETQRWLNVIKQVRKVFAEEAPQTKPWFQLDRGGDAWPVLLDGLNADDLFTVRAAHDRRVKDPDGGKARHYLWQTLKAQPVLGTVEVDIKARPERKSAQGRKVVAARTARKAQIELRAVGLQFEFFTSPQKKRTTSPKLNALLAKETAESANGETPIEWMLLTNHPIENFDDAQLVLFGYTQRWRVEEFHKCWKSGVCKVEETQLREFENIKKWAAVLAAVAMRVLRLTYLSRHHGGLPALEELAPCEIDAIVLGAKSPDFRPGTVPPIAKVVDMLAKIGGYTGKSSGGPPGPMLVARGLLKVEILADLLDMKVVAPVS